MSPSIFSRNRCHFRQWIQIRRSGAHSELCDATPERIRSSVEPWPPGIASDFNRPPKKNTRKLVSGFARPSTVSAQLSLSPCWPETSGPLTFPSPLSADPDAAPYGAGQCSAHIFRPASRHTWDSEPPRPVSFWLSSLHDAPFLANKMVNSDQSTSPPSGILIGGRFQPTRVIARGNPKSRFLRRSFHQS
jgi:hypothetical protein